jgi:hypothetical protein
MTTSQFRLVISAAATIFSSSLWLWSYFAYPGRGFLRTLILFAILFLAWRPFENDFRSVSKEQPINRDVVGGVFLAWLLLVLAAVLITLSGGKKIPLDHGPSRPIEYLVLVAPFFGLFWLRVVHIYRRLGRVGA